MTLHRARRDLFARAVMCAVLLSPAICAAPAWSDDAGEGPASLDPAPAREAKAPPPAVAAPVAPPSPSGALEPDLERGGATSAPVPDVPVEAGAVPEAGGPGAPAVAAPPPPDAAVAPSRPRPRPLPRRPLPTVPHAANEIVIRLIVEPAAVAHLYWGAKDLGVTPTEIVRPRDSGPMDLILRAPGYLTFHTRAYTDHDDDLPIHLVPIAQAATTFGYRLTPHPEPRAGKSAPVHATPHHEDPADRAKKRRWSAGVHDEDPRK